MASPARRSAVDVSPCKKVLAAAETLQVQEKAGEVIVVIRAVVDVSDSRLGFAFKYDCNLQNLHAFERR